MKLQGVVELHVPGEPLLRRPGFWDKVKKVFGSTPDLGTGKTKASLEASALVDAVREGLSRIGVTNAISLVIDEQVLFQDLEHRPDDLTDLFLAFHDHADVFGGGFDMLRLAVEHEEAGIHLVLEVVARTEHPRGEPAARIVVSGRLRDFEPRPGEDAEAYRLRVEPLTRNTALFEVHKHQIESFVAKVAQAMRAAMPEARVESAPAEARVVRPDRRMAKRPERQVAPTDRRYDPYDSYYPNPYSTVLTFMVWNSLFHSAFHPSVIVVNPAGDVLGTPAEVGQDSADLGGGDLGEGDLDQSGDFGDGFDDGGLGDGGDFGGGDFGDY